MRAKGRASYSFPKDPMPDGPTNTVEKNSHIITTVMHTLHQAAICPPVSPACRWEVSALGASGCGRAVGHNLCSKEESRKRQERGHSRSLKSRQRRDHDRDSTK